MKITIEYRNPTPTHCTVAIWVNGGFAGELTLRQEELGGFQYILADGCVDGYDEFLAKGDPNWLEKNKNV